MEYQNKKIQHTLDELEELSERLKKLKEFFSSRKTGNIKDSLLTKENLEATIKMLKEINPEEKSMIHALESLIPLSQKTDQEILLHEKRNAPILPNPENQSDYNALTPKLKSKVPLNRII